MNAEHSGQPEKLRDLLTQLQSGDHVDADPAAEPIDELVTAFLHWETTPSKAKPALQALRTELIDLNELRVCLPDEILALIGRRYPRGATRCKALRSVLCDLFRINHKLSLDHLQHKDCEQTFEVMNELDGMIPYVAQHVAQVFGHPVMPVDGLLAKSLADHGVWESEAPASADSINELSTFLNGHIDDGQHRRTHWLLRNWLDRIDVSADA